MMIGTVRPGAVRYGLDGLLSGFESEKNRKRLMGCWTHNLVRSFGL